jgi:hypothetical protein
MRSNVDEVLRDLDDAIDRRLEASGIVLVNNIKDSIRAKGLIDTSRMINDIQHQLDRTEKMVRAGSTITDPHPDYPYPKLLNNGFVHASVKPGPDNPNQGPQQATVGPFRFMEDGTARSEGELRRIWGEPIG